MTYTVEDLTPIAAVMKAASDNSKKNPAQIAKLIAKITPEEMEDLQSTGQSVMMDMMIKGETVDTLTAYLRLNETMFGYAERAFTLREFAKQFVAVVEGLDSKDVQILRDLGFPKSAQIIEYALNPAAATPEKPAWRNDKEAGNTL